MGVVAATSGPTLLWYLSRGSGLAALLALTMSMVLGIVTSVRWNSPRWPRFVIELLHRNTSLLAFTLIVVHLSTVVVDGFAPIGWKDAVIPFASPYRRVWLGLGALGFDLLIALLATSLLRHRIGHRTWRFVHWFAYLCWPLVVVHGLGTGSDTKVGYVLVLTAVCVAAVILAVWWRIAVGWPNPLGTRVSVLALSLIAPVVLVAWLAAGPLAAGWARRSGTPASVLARVGATPVVASTPPSTRLPGPTDRAAGLPAPPFSAQLDGSFSQSNPAANGRVMIRLATTLTGGATGSLTVDLNGAPVDGGGVLLATSQVTLGATGQPAAYHGEVTSLRGARVIATLRGTGLPTLQLTIDVQINQASSHVRGSVQAQPAAAAGLRGSRGTG